MKISHIVAGLAAVCIALGAGTTPSQAQTPALKKVTFLTNYTFHGRHSPFFVGVRMQPFPRTQNVDDLLKMTSKHCLHNNQVYSDW